MECERVVSDTDVTASFYFEESAPFRHVRISSSIGSISHTPCKSFSPFYHAEDLGGVARAGQYTKCSLGLMNLTLMGFALPRIAS